MSADSQGTPQQMFILAPIPSSPQRQLAIVAARLARRWAMVLGLAALVATASLSACGDVVAEDEGQCQNDGDCTIGLHCYAQRWCVAASAEPRDVVLRLSPPQGAEAVLEYFDAILGGPQADLGQVWQLTEPAAVRGTITRAGDVLTPSIPGRLIAVAPGKVHGTTLRYDATSLSAPKLVDGASVVAGFELKLQAGPNYEVAFWPDRPEIPPWFAGWKVGCTSNSWNVELPAESSLLRVRGKLLQGPAKAPDCETMPIGALPTCGGTCVGMPGFRVALLDAKGRERSSRATTADDGSFEVLVDPGVGVVELQFGGAESGDALVSGRLATPIDLDLLRKKEQSALDVGDLIIEISPETVDVKLPIQDGLGEPVAGASVLVQRSLTSVLGCVDAGAGKRVPGPVFAELHLQAEAAGDNAGFVSLRLPVGAYDVSVAPFRGHRSGSITELGLPLGEVNAPIVCPARRMLRGQVLDLQHQGLVAARVRFEQIGDDPTNNAGQLLEALTDLDGRFEAWLDPGRYAVVVDPPEGVGLARALLRVVEVQAEHDPVALELTMPAPMVLVGRVLDQAGKPVVGVSVDVLASALTALPARLGPSGAPRGRSAHLAVETHQLGSTSTNEQGRFELLVATGQVAP